MRKLILIFALFVGLFSFGQSSGTLDLETTITTDHLSAALTGPAQYRYVKGSLFTGERCPAENGLYTQGIEIMSLRQNGNYGEDGYSQDLIVTALDGSITTYRVREGSHDSYALIYSRYQRVDALYDAEGASVELSRIDCLVANWVDSNGDGWFSSPNPDFAGYAFYLNPTNLRHGFYHARLTDAYGQGTHNDYLTYRPGHGVGPDGMGNTRPGGLGFYFSNAGNGHSSQALLEAEIERVIRLREATDSSTAQLNTYGWDISVENFRLVDAREVWALTNSRFPGYTIRIGYSSFSDAHAEIGAYIDRVDNPHAGYRFAQRGHATLQEAITTLTAHVAEVNTPAPAVVYERGTPVVSPSSAPAPWVEHSGTPGWWHYTNIDFEDHFIRVFESPLLTGEVGGERTIVNGFVALVKTRLERIDVPGLAAGSSLVTLHRVEGTSRAQVVAEAQAFLSRLGVDTQSFSGRSDVDNAGLYTLPTHNILQGTFQYNVIRTGRRNDNVNANFIFGGDLTQTARIAGFFGITRTGTGRFAHDVYINFIEPAGPFFYSDNDPNPDYPRNILIPAGAYWQYSIDTGITISGLNASNRQFYGQTRQFNPSAPGQNAFTTFPAGTVLAVTSSERL